MPGASPSTCISDRERLTVCTNRPLMLWILTIVGFVAWSVMQPLPPVASTNESLVNGCYMPLMIGE